MNERAFVVRMVPLGIDRVPIGLQTGEISVGWGKASEALLDPFLPRSRFARLVHDAYYQDQRNRIASGIATGQLWRFIRDMSPGALALVPHGKYLQVARVTGCTTHDSDPSAEHWAYRRPVEWVTRDGGFLRHKVADELQRAARTRLTCIEVPRIRMELERLSARVT